MRQTRFITTALVLILLASMVSACMPEPGERGEVVSYVAVAPGTMRIGENVAVTFTLLDSEGRLAGDNVRVALLKGNREVVTAESQINGKGKVEISIPSDLAEGDLTRRYLWKRGWWFWISRSPPDSCPWLTPLPESSSVRKPSSATKLPEGRSYSISRICLPERGSPSVSTSRRCARLGQKASPPGSIPTTSLRSVARPWVRGWLKGLRSFMMHIAIINR